MKTKEIQAVYRRGVKTFHPLFRLLTLPTKQRSRFAVVVSKQISKKAVERNRIKRRLRPLLRARLAQKPGYDVVVIAQPKAIQATSAEFAQAIRKVL